MIILLNLQFPNRVGGLFINAQFQAIKFLLILIGAMEGTGYLQAITFSHAMPVRKFMNLMLQRSIQSI